MSVKSIVLAALKPVLDETWAVELPVSPVFPAIVFEVESLPEDGWVQGGDYTQHTVTVSVLARDLDEVDSIHNQAVAALEQLPEHFYLDEHGDAEYEDDASVYGYFSNHVIRTRD